MKPRSGQKTHWTVVPWRTKRAWIRAMSSYKRTRQIENKDRVTRSRRGLFILAGMGAIWAGLIALLLFYGDTKVATAVNPSDASLHSNALTMCCYLISNSLTFVILLFVVLTIISMFYKKWEPHRKMFIGMMFSLVLTSYITVIVKHAVGRQRPYEQMPGKIDTLGTTPPTDPSMPSGHSSSSAALATSFALRAKGLTLPALLFIWSLLVAFSRMYLGYHYLSDVLVGSILGTVIAFISAYLFDRLYDSGRMTIKSEWTLITVLTAAWLINWYLM